MSEELTTADFAKALGRALPRAYCDDQLGPRIRRLRREMGLRQGQLAFPGCSLSNLSQIERGIHTPSLELALKLCLMLDANPRYLCWGRGPKRLLPERQRYILEFLGVSDRDLRKLLDRRRKS